MLARKQTDKCDGKHTGCLAGKRGMREAREGEAGWRGLCAMVAKDRLLQGRRLLEICHVLLYARRGAGREALHALLRKERQAKKCVGATPLRRGATSVGSTFRTWLHYMNSADGSSGGL